MRMRTHKSRYFSVSNTTAQDQTMSFAALGLLTYCLSKPGDWEFCPKQIWKERDCGRDKIYQLFNELIEKFHCIRIKKSNPKMPHLPGEIEYEFYDDIEDCKNRIQELENIEKFIEHGYNLKKCLRRPENQEVEEVLEISALRDPDFQDPRNQDITKERGIQNKENNNVVVVAREKSRASDCGNVHNFTKDDLYSQCVNTQKDWTTPEIEEAWSCYIKSKNHITSPFDYIEGIINKKRIINQNKKPNTLNKKNICKTNTQNHSNQKLEKDKEHYAEPDMKEPLLAKYSLRGGRNKN